MSVIMKDPVCTIRAQNTSSKNKLFSFQGSQCVFVQVREVRGVFQVQEGLRGTCGQQARAQDVGGGRETQVQEGVGGTEQGPQGDPGQEGGRDGAENHREGQGGMQGTGGRRGPERIHQTLL